MKLLEGAERSSLIYVMRRLVRRINMERSDILVYKATKRSEVQEVSRLWVIIPVRVPGTGTFKVYGTGQALQSSRVLLDTPILAGLAAVHSKDHGSFFPERVPPLL